MAHVNLRPRRWMALPAAVVIAALVTASRRRRTMAQDRPADVGFMLAMHDAFRRDLGRLERAVDAHEHGQLSDAERTGWEGFRDALVVHHAAEDDDLWPVLRAHLDDPGDRAVVDEMVAEHRAIPAALDAVDDALRTGRGARRAVRELAALVRDHLDHEEAAVLPLLERHLSRREWRSFLLTERGRRSFAERADFIGWVLDDAEPEDRDAVMAELPPPAHVVYRLVLRPRYEAQHRWAAAA